MPSRRHYQTPLRRQAPQGCRPKSNYVLRATASAFISPLPPNTAAAHQPPCGTNSCRISTSPSLHAATNPYFPLTTTRLFFSLSNSPSPISRPTNPSTAARNTSSPPRHGTFQSSRACTTPKLNLPPRLLTPSTTALHRPALSHRSTTFFITTPLSHGHQTNGPTNNPKTPSPAPSNSANELNPATSTTPAKSHPPSSPSCSVNDSTAAAVTAVPRLCPTSTMREAGMPAVWTAQLMAARASAMRPASVGVPVERPKPR